MRLSAEFLGARNFSHAIDRSFPTPQFLLPRAAGVDISDASIKWLTLAPSHGTSRQEVNASGDLPLPPGIVVDGIVHDAHALAEALKHIKARLGTSTAHAALPEEAAYVFSMHVPLGTGRAQILSMIEFEFDGRVPIPPSQAVYDFNVIEEQDGSEGKEISVTVFPRNLSEAYALAFNEADIALLSLEVEARSIARAVSSSDALEPITLIVDFGRARTGFAVVKRGIPIFTSTVEVGGNSIMNALMRALSISRDEAEAFANNEGLIDSGGAQSAAGSKKGIEAITGTASALADEIAKHYHYWDTRRNDRGERMTPVGKITLVGGSANVRGLCQYIAGRVQAPVEQGNIWRHICTFDDYIPSIDRRTSLQFATAAGLALRST